MEDTVAAWSKLRFGASLSDIVSWGHVGRQAVALNAPPSLFKAKFLGKFRYFKEADGFGRKPVYTAGQPITEGFECEKPSPSCSREVAPRRCQC